MQISLKASGNTTMLGIIELQICLEAPQIAAILRIEDLSTASINLLKENPVAWDAAQGYLAQFLGRSSGEVQATFAANADSVNCATKLGPTPSPPGPTPPGPTPLPGLVGPPDLIDLLPHDPSG
jgi:hypothetical protein